MIEGDGQVALYVDGVVVASGKTEMPANVARPVSYTHLTLPTSDLV